MQRTPLRSRALVSAGYDAAAQLLELEFHNGRVYRYREVPPGVFDFLMRTASKGSFVNRMIDGRYSYEEVSEPAAEVDVMGLLEASLRAREGENDS
jgi:lysozyme family protein